MFETANWYLVIMLSFGGSASSSSQTGPYFSENACNAAGNYVYERQYSQNSARTRSPKFLNFICVPVPTEGD